MEDYFYQALKKRYQSEIAGYKGELEILWAGSFSALECSEILPRIDRSLEGLVRAEEKLETLERHYKPE